MLFRSCLTSNTNYLFSARIRLSRQDMPIGSLTTCASSGENCIELYSTVKTLSSKVGTHGGYMTQIQSPLYGVWVNFYATLQYEPNDLSQDIVYQILQIRGPEAGVDVEVDDVSFTLPSVLSDQSNVCLGNLVVNGDAEGHFIHPYPLTFQGGYLSVEYEDENYYFRQRGRRSNGDSIVYVFDHPYCLVEGAKYKVSAKIRIHSEISIASKIELRQYFKNNTNFAKVIADCPVSTNDGWTTCESRGIFPSGFTGDDVLKVQLEFETLGEITDMDVDDITLALIGGSTTSIVVQEDGVSDCWSTGAEILITSHTLDFQDGQVRKLISPPVSLGDGFVRLDLDTSIIPPTTKHQSKDFAVEIALLSRNIRFEGATDSDDPLFGAHLMVMQTPDVVQHLEGVEFRNFGQQGLLGRYPIHFHLSLSVKGSLVLKNSIRDSYQRCIVIHGTNDLIVAENVAYKNSGHCYMLEDGGEVGNTFRLNLGSHTTPATRKVSAQETDHVPSTFWCTNPQNEWTGNVAAGSSHSGFWFELKDVVRGPSANLPLFGGMSPRFMKLAKFTSNVAHSNGDHGLRSKYILRSFHHLGIFSYLPLHHLLSCFPAYPSGFMPPEEAVFYDTKSYKNKGGGVFFHNSRDLAISGGILADNRIQADFDKADNIRIEGTSIIGISPAYRDVIESQHSVPVQSDTVIGLQLHGFTFTVNGSGATIRNISFSGFLASDSMHTALMDVDDAFQGGHFTYWSTISGISIEGGAVPNFFDFRAASDNNYSDVYITDLDSSVKPGGSPFVGVSTAISNTQQMTAFLNKTRCVEFDERRYMYCENTCFRTVTYATDPTETIGLTLKVTATSDPSKSVIVRGFYKEANSTMTTWIRNRLMFAASLPFGSYSATFMNAYGQAVWPSFVETTFAPRQCSESISPMNIALETPNLSITQCRDLIRNGDMETSMSYPNYWLHHESGGVQILPGGGLNKSNALGDVTQLTTSGALGQSLDTRCLIRGEQYEMRAWVKLLKDGFPISCDSVDGCPVAKIRIRTAENSDGLFFQELTIDIATYFVRPYNNNGWNMLQGVFTIDQRLASGDSVSFFVERRMINFNMSLDNISIVLIPKQCNELVFNGQFADGNSISWERSAELDVLKLDVVYVRGNTALKMTGRTSNKHAPMQSLRVGCIRAGQWFIASARVRLENANGSLFLCDASILSGDLACPRMTLRAFGSLGQPMQKVVLHDGGIAVTDFGTTSDGWLTMSGTFSATSSEEAAEKLSLSFEEVANGKSFVIDDVSISPLAMNCSQLLLNGDANYGDTPRFWRLWASGGNALLRVINLSGNRYFKLSNRTVSGDGISQYVDPRCIVGGATWKLKAKMSIMLSSNQTGATCDPASSSLRRGCPPLAITGWRGGNKIVDVMFKMSNIPDTWNANSLNEYEAKFTVPALLSSCDRVSISIRSFNVDWDLFVDDLVVVPA